MPEGRLRRRAVHRDVRRGVRERADGLRRRPGVDRRRRLLQRVRRQRHQADGEGHRRGARAPAETRGPVLPHAVPAEAGGPRDRARRGGARRPARARERVHLRRGAAGARDERHRHPDRDEGVPSGRARAERHGPRAGGAAAEVRRAVRGTAGTEDETSGRQTSPAERPQAAGVAGREEGAATSRTTDRRASPGEKVTPFVFTDCHMLAFFAQRNPYLKLQH